VGRPKGSKNKSKKSKAETPTPTPKPKKRVYKVTALVTFNIELTEKVDPHIYFRDKKGLFAEKVKKGKFNTDALRVARYEW